MCQLTLPTTTKQAGLGPVTECHLQAHHIKVVNCDHHAAGLAGIGAEADIGAGTTQATN